MPKLDTSTLQAALIGYQEELGRIDAEMAAIRKQLGVHSGGAPPVTDGRKAKHHISAAGRKHIVEAQRKRWAAYHGKRKAPAKVAKTAKPKRKMSPERKTALLANLAKARAAKAAKESAT